MPASILLNLFLIAVIGGHIWRAEFYETRTEKSMAQVLAEMEAFLPAADAAAFHAVMDRDAPRYMLLREHVVAARGEVKRLMTAERFNPQEARQALVAWRVAFDQFFDSVTGSFSEALGQISSEGRSKLIAGYRVKYQLSRSPLAP